MKMFYGQCFANQALSHYLLFGLADFCFLDTWLVLALANLVVNKFPFCFVQVVPSVGLKGGWLLGWFGNHIIYNKFIIYACCLTLLCLLAIDGFVHNLLRSGSNCFCDCFNNVLVHLVPTVKLSWHSIVPLTIQPAMIHNWFSTITAILGSARYCYEIFVNKYFLNPKNLVYVCSISQNNEFMNDPICELDTSFLRLL